jgi:hypothetical protein
MDGAEGGITLLIYLMSKKYTLKMVEITKNRFVFKNTIKLNTIILINYL